jgi:hypothetical protein
MADRDRDETSSNYASGAASSGNMPDEFDRLLGQLDGLTGATRTRQSTVQTITPIVGNSETFIVQTIRHAEVGDYLFVQAIGPKRSYRLVLPPEVTAVIDRQRDSLTTMNRRKGARAAVETRAAKGITPAFLKNRGAKRKAAK